MTKLARPLVAAGLMLWAAQGTLAAPASADLSAEK
jgi:hypothetical protein